MMNTHTAIPTKDVLEAERTRLRELMIEFKITPTECEIMARNLGADAHYLDFQRLRSGIFGLASIGNVKPVVEAIVAARRAAQTKPGGPTAPEAPANG